MVTDDGVNGDLSKELTARLGDTEQENRRRNTNGAVDTILDGRKNRDEHTNEVNQCIQGRDAPELVHCVGGCDEVTNSMNDDTGKRRFGNVEENSGQAIDGNEDQDGRDASCKRSSNTGLGLNGGSREGSCGRIGT